MIDLARDASWTSPLIQPLSTQPQDIGVEPWLWNENMHMVVKQRYQPKCYRWFIFFNSVDPTWLFLKQNLSSDPWKKQHGLGVKIKESSYGKLTAVVVWKQDEQSTEERLFLGSRSNLSFWLPGSCSVLSSEEDGQLA